MGEGCRKPSPLKELNKSSRSIVLAVAIINVNCMRSRHIKNNEVGMSQGRIRTGTEIVTELNM
jgi:hypothetical protein